VKTAFKTWVSENGHGTLICSSTIWTKRHLSLIQKLLPEHKHTHTHLTSCSTWTTKAVDKILYALIQMSQVAIRQVAFVGQVYNPMY